jgi:hypothetical protein
LAPLAIIPDAFVGDAASPVPVSWIHSGGVNCMSAARAILGALSLAVSCLPVHALEGRYKVEGQNPGQSQTYRGEAVVKRTGETYSLVWQIGSGRQIGTGLLTGSVLSVVFQSVGSQGGGVASFETSGDRIVGGRWTVVGGQATGIERWTREP